MKKSDEKLWSVPVVVAQVPEHGLHLEIEADAALREVMAAAAKLREISLAKGSFDVTAAERGSFHVTGTVRARVGQICVVTLDPIENEIEEAVDVMFEPPGSESSPATSRRRPAGEEDDEDPDAPEPLVNGQIDLGRLAQDFLFLGIDPYPRKAGAVFEVAQEAPDPEDHPFAALKALKKDTESPPAGKPKRR